MYFQMNKAGLASSGGESTPETWKEWAIAIGVNLIIFGVGALAALLQ